MRKAKVSYFERLEHSLVKIIQQKGADQNQSGSVRLLLGFLRFPGSLQLLQDLCVIRCAGLRNIHSRFLGEFFFVFVDFLCQSAENSRKEALLLSCVLLSFFFFFQRIVSFLIDQACIQGLL